MMQADGPHTSRSDWRLCTINAAL